MAQVASLLHVRLQLRVLWQSTLQTLCLAQVLSHWVIDGHDGEHPHEAGHVGAQLLPWQLVVGVHTPPRQTEPAPQAVPVAQPMPSFAGVATQACWDSLQLPMLQALLMLEQSRAPPPVHAPPTQCSPVVQNTWSSQLIPSCPAC
jgi:hypothetical protein